MSPKEFQDWWHGLSPEDKEELSWFYGKFLRENAEYLEIHAEIALISSQADAIDARYAMVKEAITLCESRIAKLNAEAVERLKGCNGPESDS